MAIVSLAAIKVVSAASVFNNDLYYGLVGNADVSQLQEFLTQQGEYGGPITGNFYVLTLDAVKSFQQAQAISPVSGYFGPLSRAAANTILNSEIGTSESSSTSIATTTDTQQQISELNSKIQSLLAQVASLQQQAQSQTQALQTIASNTAPVAPVPMTQTPAVTPVTPSPPQPFIKWLGQDFISNGTSCSVTPLNQEIYTPPNGNPFSNPLILSTTTSGSVSLVAPLSPAGRNTMYRTLYPDGLHLTTSTNIENIRNQYGEINNDFSLDPSNPRFLYALNTNDPNAYSLFTISCSVNGMTTTTKVRQNCTDNNGTGGCLTQ